MHTDRADETCVLFVFLHQSVALAIASPVHPTHPLCNSRVHAASTTPVQRNCKAACWYTPVRVVGSECYTVKNAKLAQKERKKRKMKRREGAVRRFCLHPRFLFTVISVGKYSSNVQTLVCSAHNI